MFLPKKSKIFDSLVKQASIIKESAELFQKIVDEYKDLGDGSVKMKELEHQADMIVHEVTDEIEKTFILPLDKEDIRDLTEMLDDIIDNLEETANRFKIYRLKKSNKPLKEFSAIILKAVEQIHKGVTLVKDRKMDSEEFVLCYKELHNLENQGDKLHRKVLEELMNRASPEFKSTDVLLTLKWKESFQTLENTLDKCEDIAVLFERLRVKYR